MKTLKIFIILILGFVATNSVVAQNSEPKNFAVKANAEIGLGNSISTSSYLGSRSTKATSGDYGLDLGWTFWRKKAHSLELNVGIAYSPTSVKLDLGAFNYDYSAPSYADMDGDTYQRYYQLKGVNQKVSYNRLTIPIYASYYYLCNKHLGIHADLGVRLGFKTASKISNATGEAYSYGIYPQYDDLMIDATYLNDFGTTNLANAKLGNPKSNGFSASMLVGVGVEYRINDRFGAEIGLRYNPGFTNFFKGENLEKGVTNESAPVKYSVAEGQQIAALSNYLKSSKLNQLSLKIGFITRF